MERFFRFRVVSVAIVVYKWGELELRKEVHEESGNDVMMIRNELVQNKIIEIFFWDG